MRVLDLFSGIGGFSLGLERAGMKTVAFCENDKKARLVLKKHWPDVPIYEDVRKLTYDKLKEDGLVARDPKVQRSQKIDKIQERENAHSRGVCRDGDTGSRGRKQTPSIDLICGGFPCQGHSVAGKRKGKEDNRYLWPQYFRLIQEIGPRWVIVENVTGIISDLVLDQVLSDLESEDYSCQTFIIPACAVNAPHRRDRVWVIAESTGNGFHRPELRKPGKGNKKSPERKKGPTQTGGSSPLGEDVADPNYKREPQPKGDEQEQRGRTLDAGKNVSNALQFDDDRSGYDSGSVCGERPQTSELPGSQENVSHPNLSRTASGGNDSRMGRKWEPLKDPGKYVSENWLVEPDVGRVAHGIPFRVDRLKQLGNAVVPDIPEIIGRAILEADNALH